MANAVTQHVNFYSFVGICGSWVRDFARDGRGKLANDKDVRAHGRAPRRSHSGTQLPKCSRRVALTFFAFVVEDRLLKTR